MRAIVAALALLLACAGHERGAEPPPEQWTVVDARGELLDVLARSGSRRVLLDVTARWCLPCAELRTRTFADERVQRALAEYVTIEVDVTDESREQLALGRFFGAYALPCVLRFDDAKVLRDALVAQRPLAPTPSLTLRTFVAPDELLAALGH